MVNSCIDVFLLFEGNDQKETLSSLVTKHPKGIGEEAMYNILIELRNIGLVQKESEFYIVAKEVDITKTGFVNYITEKFQNYTPYLALKKANHFKITKDIVLQVLKTTFKQEFQDSTWDAYAKNLISWFLTSELDIKSKISEPTRGRGIGTLTGSVTGGRTLTKMDLNQATPRHSLKEVLEIIPLLEESSASINHRIFRDLMLIGVIDDRKNLTGLGKDLIFNEDKERLLKEFIVALPKMAELQKDVLANPKIKTKELVRMKPSDFFAGKEESSKIIYATKALSWVR